MQVWQYLRPQDVIVVFNLDAVSLFQIVYREHTIPMCTAAGDAFFHFWNDFC